MTEVEKEARVRVNHSALVYALVLLSLVDDDAVPARENGVDMMRSEMQG